MSIPPVAGRRGLFAALIVFIVLAVILGLTTYVFYSAKEKERYAKEEAQAELERGKAALNEANDEKADYVEATGWSTAAQAKSEVTKRLTALHNVMKDLEIAINPALPPTAETLLKENDDTIFSLTGKLKATQLALVDALFARTRADAEKKAMEEAKNDELYARIRELTEARAENVAMREQYEADIKELRDEIREISGEFRTAQDDWAITEQDLRKEIAVLSARIDEIRPEIRDPLITDGEVLKADLERNFVIVNIGKQHHVRPDMEFHVFGQPGPEETVDKGIIRISNIYDSHSLAAIMKSYPEHPILVGDRISSPFYDRVRPQRFVITGELKLYDRATLTNIIKNAGGEIQPQVVPDTDYLIVGKITPGMQTEQEQLSRARHYGVPVMTEERLLEYISHK